MTGAGACGRTRAGFGAAACLFLLLASGACGGADRLPGADTPSGAGTRGFVTGEVTVLAAASLTEAFHEIGAGFEAANPGTTVTFSLAGSQQLAGQVLAGVPADVFASADEQQMARVVDASLTRDDPAVFARNHLAIAVEPGNPRGIAGLADLADADLTVVLAAAEVPVGRYAREALEGAGVDVAPDSLEPDARAVLAKVALGEADAGIVYETDVAARLDHVEGIAIGAAHDRVARYPVVALADAPAPDLADRFVAYVLSESGREVLADHGFDLP